MARLPYAAHVLAAEAGQVAPDVTYEPVGDPDGFGVYRTVRFDKEHSADVARALGYLGDRRVHSVNYTDAGYTHVTFSPDSVDADDRGPFMIGLALEVLDEPQPDDDWSDPGEVPGEE